MKKSGNINFIIDTSGMKPGNISFNDIHAKITKLSLETTDYQITADIETINVFAEDDEEEMDNLVLRIFSVIAHYYGFSIIKIRKLGASLPYIEGGLYSVYSNFETAWNIEPVRKEIEHSVTEIIKNSLNANENELRLISQFVTASSQSDKVSRFMFMYNLALQLNSDNQKELDVSIRKIAPESVSHISPFTNKEETIYTKLRNQVAHDRKGTTLDQTEKEIAGIVNEFQKIVRSMLPVLSS